MTASRLTNLSAGPLLLLAALLGSVPAEAEGQNPPPRRPEPPDTGTLVFEREVFVYPAYARRDPFRPLLRGLESGPRFEEVTLTGILYSPNPALALAVFAPRAQGGGGREGRGGVAQRTYRLRKGDTLGNFRILEIHPNRVVVEVDEFGLKEQRIMELRRPGQGGLE